MTKSKKPKFYAVKVGRDGPQIYTSWDVCKAKTSRYPHSQHKSFPTRKEAEAWLGFQPQGHGPPPGAEVIDVDEFIPAPKRKREVNRSHEVIDVDESDNEGSAPQRPRLCETIDLTQEDGVECTRTEQSAGVAEPSSPDIPPQSTIVLSPEQEEVLKLVQEGKSVFFTGSAGTGKSVLLREIIARCKGPAYESLAVTATTGIAAVNIGGCTINSWASIRLGHEKAKVYIGSLLFGSGEKISSALKRWTWCRTLIIDEISMLDGDLFDKLEEIARGVRRSNKPFGGIQLVLCGDFCQLPPIGDKAKFAFDALSWKRCIQRMITLKKVFRQKDQEFVDILNEMRIGEMSAKTIVKLRTLNQPVDQQDGFEPTELYPTRAEVKKANDYRLDLIKEPAMLFTSLDDSGVDSDGKPVSEDRRERMLNGLLAQKSLTLKVGAHVMLIKNLKQGRLVNGSIGKVIKFMRWSEVSESARARPDNVGSKKPWQDPLGEPLQNSGELWPYVKFLNGMELLVAPEIFDITNAYGMMEVQRTQVPLILAWALSIHKSQGQTLERVKVNLAKSFTDGQVYVALSRATKLSQLQILGFNPSKVTAHRRVLQWYATEFPATRDNRQSEVEEEMDDEYAMTQFYS